MVEKEKSLEELGNELFLFGEHIRLETQKYEALKSAYGKKQREAIVAENAKKAKEANGKKLPGSGVPKGNKAEEK